MQRVISGAREGAGGGSHIVRPGPRSSTRMNSLGDAGPVWAAAVMEESRAAGSMAAELPAQGVFPQMRILSASGPGHCLSRRRPSGAL
jgi:hypothetical protein